MLVAELFYLRTGTCSERSGTYGKRSELRHLVSFRMLRGPVGVPVISGTAAHGSSLALHISLYDCGNAHDCWEVHASPGFGFRNAKGCTSTRERRVASGWRSTPGKPSCHTCVVIIQSALPCRRKSLQNRTSVPVDTRARVPPHASASTNYISWSGMNNAAVSASSA